jgi:primosomal protein N' (replication factor Y)
VLLRIAVPVPQLDLLTYRVADGDPPPPVGARVVVPLGSRLVTGVVVEAGSEADLAGGTASEIRPIARVLDDEPFVPPEVVDLARWTAEYYAAGAGAAIMAVLPPRTRGTRVDVHKTRRVARLTPNGLVALAESASPNPAAVDAGRASRRKDGAPVRRRRHLSQAARAALAALAHAPEGQGDVPVASLQSAGVSAAALATLARNGLVEIRSERVERDPFASGSEPPSSAQALDLTPEQAAAVSRLEAVLDAGRFRVALLHGVTGSGKTEVYLRLAVAARVRGRRALMLVPEIALTPAVAAAFRAAFGSRVAIQHSGLSDGERHDQWQRIRRGDIDVVVGTRSAVFAPLDRLGLIVVDEEHDSAYKQEESPRYHGRDVAIVRAQKADALVVLGSATPSIETYYRATTGKYEHVTLAQRVLERALPSVNVIDMREAYADEGPDVVLSRPLRDAIEARLAAQEQALVLLNRRGFATAVFCRQCAGTIDCPNCSVSLVVHGAGKGRRARCHYCNWSAPVPPTCPACAAPYLEHAGYGTERVEAEIARLWPAARVARLDRDAIRRKGSLVALLNRFRGGDIDILVGTQMIAKGHDFPRVTLVGVISADVGLGMADFRASERTFQLLTQVAGRAGRGDRPGEAFIQTIYPHHYSIELACRQDYQSFYSRELKFRQTMWYPPRVALVNIVVRAASLATAMDDARTIAGAIERGVEGSTLRVLGPAPAALARLRGEFRVQIRVKGGNRRLMRQAVQAALAARPAIARRTVVDVDPLSVL